MKKYEDVIWTEKVQKRSFKEEIKEKLKRFIDSTEIEEEDRYELEACRTLTYDAVVSWLMLNKPRNFDAALLHRFKSSRNKKFPLAISIVYIADDKPLFGREYLKKMIYCTYIDNELDDLFNGKDSIIVK